MTANPGGITATGTSSPITVTGLSNGTSYTFTVTAENTAGTSAPSESSESVTPAPPPDTQAPTAPTGLTAAAASSSQINVVWSASTDNVGVITYLVFRGGAFRATVNAPALSFSDAGLAPAIAYSYTVAACDAAGNCSAKSAAASAATLATGSATFIPSLERSWNLLGNSLNTTLDVAAIFGNQDSPVEGITENIDSIWKWNAIDRHRAFYSPRLTLADIATHAGDHNFDVLSSINPAEGYWVNAINPLTLPVQSGTAFNWIGSDFLHGSTVFQDLPAGFNLIAHADSVTPSDFNDTVSRTPPEAGGVVPTDNFKSLWAWDALRRNWYFYAPLLESTGGLNAVKAYAYRKNYLHFQDFGKTLGAGVGFWVDRSSPQ